MKEKMLGTKKLGSTRNLVEEVKSVDRNTPTFPMEAFPSKMQDILKKLKDPYGFPYDGLALDMLVASSGAIGNSIVVKFNGNEESLNLFAVHVAPSGGGKTPDLNFATRPLFLIDEQNEKEFNNAFAKYSSALLNAKNENSKKPKEQKKIPQLLEHDFRIDWIRENGRLPMFNQIVLGNTTFEAIKKTLKDSPRGGLWVSQEIMQILDNFNRYSGGKGGDERELLDFEKPGYSKTSRAGVGDHASHIVIQKGYLSMLGGIQDDFVKQLFKDGRDVSGFAARFIFTWAKYEDRPHYKVNNDNSKVVSSEIVRACLSTWSRVIRRLYEVPYLPPTDGGEEICTKLSLSQDALIVATSYLNGVIDISNSQIDSVVRAYVSKVETKLFSLIGILHALELSFEGEEITRNTLISRETVERACALMDYYTGMWVKTYKEHKFGIVARLTERQDKLFKLIPEEATATQIRKIAQDNRIMSRQAVDKWLKSDKLNIYLTEIKDKDGKSIKFIKTNTEEL